MNNELISVGNTSLGNARVLIGAAVLLSICACSRNPEAATVKRIPAGTEFSGFLSSYANLKPNANLEHEVSYVSIDPVKNVHKYVAIIVDKPEVYLATNSNEKLFSDKGRASLVEYFQNAITSAVEDAFPVVETPGPLVLRLRSALVGVDVGGLSPTDQKETGLDHSINIGKVGVEMELVDSETGQQVAAAIDHENLGDGASVGSTTFSREEKYRAATEAFDGWASRLRQFLDSAHELSNEDVARIEQTNFPYVPTRDSKRK